MDDDRKNLSLEAQELIRLTEKPESFGNRLDEQADLAAILNENPNLLKGLNEYMQWRDQHMQAVAESKKTAPAGHGISKLVSQLKKTNSKKNKK